MAENGKETALPRSEVDTIKMAVLFTGLLLLLTLIASRPAR
jgi:hypothetical protein